AASHRWRYSRRSLPITPAETCHGRGYRKRAAPDHITASGNSANSGLSSGRNVEDRCDRLVRHALPPPALLPATASPPTASPPTASRPTPYELGAGTVEWIDAAMVC